MAQYAQGLSGGLTQGNLESILSQSSDTVDQTALKALQSGTVTISQLQSDPYYKDIFGG